MGVNTFDILKLMGERNLKIKMFPRGNVTQVWNGKNGGTIQMKVDSETAAKLMLQEPMIFGLLIADADEFQSIKGELETTLS